MIDGIGSRLPLDIADAGEETPLAALFATVDDLDAVAAPPGREVSVEAALLAPSAAHAAQIVDLGRITAALARVAQRPPRAGETPAESRMKKIAEKYLALRLEVAAGMARISVG